MKRFLSLLLVLAMLFSVCTMFTACDDSYSASDRDDDDDDDNKKEKNRVFQGLNTSLGKAYKVEEESDGYVCYSNGKYNVFIQIAAKPREVSTKDLWESYLEALEAGEEEGEVTDITHGKNKDTYYAGFTKTDEPESVVVAFYATDVFSWVVSISNCEDYEEFDLEDMVDLITGWECNNPDIDGELPEPMPALPAPEASEAPEVSADAHVNDLTLDLFGSFTYLGGYDTYAEYESDGYYLFVNLFNDQYYSDAYDFINKQGFDDMEAYGEENGVPFGYNIENGFASIIAFYVQDGCCWFLMINSKVYNEYSLDEMINLATRHYFE